MKTTHYLRIPDTDIIYQYTRYKSGNCTKKLIFADNRPHNGSTERITAAEYNEAITTLEKAGE